MRADCAKLGRIILVFALALVAFPTFAQQVLKLPQTFTISPGGVDMATGIYYDQHDDIASGDLTLTRSYISSYVQTGDDWNPFENGFPHNLRIAIMQRRIPRAEGGGMQFDDWIVTVYLNQQAYAFKRPYNITTFEQIGQIQGRILTFTGGSGFGGTQTYTFTDIDDTKYVFRPTSFVTSSECGPGSSPCAYISQITRPSGDRINFDYDVDGTTGKSRLRLVRNNRGFALGLEFAGLNITKVCAINRASSYFAASSACPAGVPTATYGYSGNFTYTQPAGGTWTYTGSSIIRPGESQPWITWQSQCCTSIARQDFADGSWYTYSFGGGTLENPVSSFTGPNGTTTLQFNNYLRYIVSDPPLEYVITKGPTSVTDPLNRTTLTEYCPPGSEYGCAQQIGAVPSKQTLPEGNYSIFFNDNYGSPLIVEQHPKSGSALQARRSEVEYATAIPGGKQKPLKIYKPYLAPTRPANQPHELFTYDTTHGQVLTKTSPAVGGINPQIRYAYASRSAWLKASGSGYVADPNPIWLLTDERFCRTSAASGAGCVAGAGDLVVTTYDYGPNSGPNNLLLRGKVVTADGVSLRTCYGYDAQGNRISETLPRAALASCP